MAVRRTTARRALLALLTVCLCVFAQSAVSVRAFAAFTGSTSVVQANVSSAVLSPPTALAATGSCQALLVGPQIKLTWTATTSTFATGYRVLRGTTNGGPYTFLTSVSGSATVTYTDTTVTGLNSSYYYVLQAQIGNWTSANSTQAAGTTPVLCL